MTHTVKTFESFAWNHLSKLTEYGLTYIFGVLLARKLGAHDYSIYVTLISISSFSMIFGGLGFDETLNRYIPQLSFENKILSIRSLVKKLLFIRISLLSIIGLLLILFRAYIASLLNNTVLSEFILYLSLYIVLQSVVNFFSNIFISQLKTRIVFLINFITKLITLLVGVYLLNLGQGVKEIIILLVVISLTSIFLYIFVGCYKYIFSESEGYDSLPAIKFGLTAWGNLILTFMLGKNSNILIISFLLGATVQVSYYEIAFSFTQLIEYVFSIGFMGVALSSFSALAVQNSSRLKFLRSSIMKYLQLFNIPIGLMVFFNAAFIIPLIYSSQYLVSIQLLKIFMIFNMLSISLLGSGTNTAILLSIGKESIVLFIHMIFALLNIVLLWLFVPIYGVFGAIFITGLCLSLTVLTEFTFATKYIGLNYDFKFIIKIFLISLAALTISEISRNFLFNNYFFSISLYILLVSTGYFIFRIPNKEIKALLSGINFKLFNK
jgi:O-antigen/teichoic acid export membrane protein